MKPAEQRGREKHPRKLCLVGHRTQLREHDRTRYRADRSGLSHRCASSCLQNTQGQLKMLDVRHLMRWQPKRQIPCHNDQNMGFFARTDKNCPDSHPGCHWLKNILVADKVYAEYSVLTTGGECSTRNSETKRSTTLSDAGIIR